MLRVERQGPIVKLVYEGGEREAVSASCWSTLGLGCVSATRNKLLIYATPSLGATSSVSECGCAVVVADTEGRDPHQVIDAVAEHLRDVGLRPQLSFDKDRLVGLISLESGGRIAVVLAHPCLEAWLGELLGITSSACSDLINAIKQKRGEYDKSRLPSLVKAELRNRTDPPKFVEDFQYAVTCCGGGRATA